MRSTIMQRVGAGVAVLGTTGVLAALPAPAGAHPAVHNCGSASLTVKKVKAVGVSCAIAKRYAKHDACPVGFKGFNGGTVWEDPTAPAPFRGEDETQGCYRNSSKGFIWTYETGHGEKV